MKVASLGLANIRLGLTGTNALAYLEYSHFVKKKVFAILSPEPNVIKLFTSVIDELSYYARLFIRLCWKRLSGTNTLAYYENV